MIYTWIFIGVGAVKTTHMLLFRANLLSNGYIHMCIYCIYVSKKGMNMHACTCIHVTLVHVLIKYIYTYVGAVKMTHMLLFRAN
jgi:hypothetical protein